MPITPISDGDAVSAATINSRFTEIESDFEDIKDGTVALDSPDVTSFTNAEHSHETAAGGSTLRPQAIASASGDIGKVLTADGAAGSWELVGIPTGILMPFAGGESAVPAGYLICNGQAISRSTYSMLFTAIGGGLWRGKRVVDIQYPRPARPLPAGAGQYGRHICQSGNRHAGRQPRRQSGG